MPQGKLHLVIALAVLPVLHNEGLHLQPQAGAVSWTDSVTCGRMRPVTAGRCCLCAAQQSSTRANVSLIGSWIRAPRQPSTYAAALCCCWFFLLQIVAHLSPPTVAEVVSSMGPELVNDLVMEIRPEYTGEAELRIKITAVDAVMYIVEFGRNKLSYVGHQPGP